MGTGLAEIDAKKLIRGVLSVKGTAKVPGSADRSIWVLHQKGKSATEIAQARSVDLKTVTAAIRRVDKFFYSQVAVEVAELKMQHHLTLDWMKKEAQKAWHKSKGKVVRRRTKYGPNPLDPEQIIALETEETEEYKAGDPRFLLAMDKFMSAQRELWPGANAPKASALTNVDGTSDAKVTIDVRAAVKNMGHEKQLALMEFFNAVQAKVIESQVVKPHE